MRTLSTIVLSLFFVCAFGQTPQEEISQNICRAGANYYAYPMPTKQLTSAPEGKSPFYISHYGRHGSRYMDSEGAYYDPLQTFLRADSAGCLTDKGREVLEKLRLMSEESEHRVGDLTLLGAQQHQGIAHRMYEHFPEVFSDGVVVDAKSTTVRRCILSMANELMELSRLNPTLDIRSDASKHDMYYMNLQDSVIWENHTNSEIEAYLEDWTKKNVHPEHTMNLLFTDVSKVEQFADIDELYEQLYKSATIVQDCEIRHRLSLYDIFTEEDLFALWQTTNIWWFCAYGRNVMNGCIQPYSQRNLLHKIISEADSCIVLDHPGATLRFGHDTIVLPLTCLLNLNGYGKEMHPDELLENNWANYRIFPMACNIQIIFYRANPEDKDIWVKVLLNEEETSLPFAPVEGPYYRWADFKDYYTAVLDAYKED